uniref:Regulating synaptic membrane exocytosis 2 n=1 Tax=Eptatretus burgeri TaxID=7764 RepID=A0A8C4QLK0_EPTBU
MASPLGLRGPSIRPPGPAPDSGASPGRGPELPDLSHLTEEERKIILGVMERQRQEEEKEQAMLKCLHQQFESYKEQIKQIGEESRKQQGDGKDDAPTCGICRKTKFADGCGHLCSYCQTKFCARCGGRVTLRSNKIMWVCNLCRKQQEILIKSGAWYPAGSGPQSLGPASAPSDGALSDTATGRVRSLSQSPLGNGAPRIGGPGVSRARQPERPAANALGGRGQTGSQRARSEPPGERIKHIFKEASLMGVPREGRERERERERERRGARKGGEGERDGEGEEGGGVRRGGRSRKGGDESELGRGLGDRGTSGTRTGGTNSRWDRRHSDVALPGAEGGDIPCVSMRRPRYTQSPGPSAGVGPNTPTISAPGASLSLQRLEPAGELGKKGKREKLETMLRNDSLSSDQSESVRPPPPKPHKIKAKIAGGGRKRRALVSSSDEEIASTPEFTSCEEVEMESESISEKGNQDPSRHMQTPWGSSEMSPFSPVAWQPSREGERLIGHITLKKRLREHGSTQGSTALLGLKVVGGKMSEAGVPCAYITKVKKGSIADVVGHLRAGDEVLEWNQHSLRGASFQEVYDVILRSKSESQVELLVSRPVGETSRIPDGSQPQLDSSSSSFESQKMDRPSISVTSPVSPSLRDVPQTLPGRLSIKLWYDKVNYQLVVTVLCATELPPRLDARPRNPYVKVYFLPDRSDKSKRRTKTSRRTLEPRWGQTFVYCPVHRREFRERMLELTLWDQPRVPEEESEFLGEILIELETALLDDEPHWYSLQTHDTSSLPLPRPSPYLSRKHAQGHGTKKLQREFHFVTRSSSRLG